jgi:hypothetical protein
MTTAEFFEYLARRDASRSLGQSLFSAWAGVPPCRVASVPVAVSRRAQS